MKETYYWVPWFKALSKRIAEIEDGDRKEFIDLVKRVEWNDGGKTVNIVEEHKEYFDPLSFIYRVASKNRETSREKILDSISEVFGLRESVEADKLDFFVRHKLVFPTPTPKNLNFWHDKQPRNPDVLWTLLKCAVNGFSNINSTDFSEALIVAGIGVTKLTQVLTLINATDFLSMDKALLSLKLETFERVPNTDNAQYFTLEVYKENLKLIRSIFPGCELYEIGLLAYTLKDDEFRKNLRKHFQITTNKQHDGIDRWETFSEDNCVFTEHDYPQLQNASNGSIVIAGSRKSDLHGIGVISNNEYIEERGWDKNRKIDVIWVNKFHANLDQRFEFKQGFSQLEGLNEIKSVEQYRQTLEHLASICPPPVVILKPVVILNPHFPSNQILYGPPGTGKTWHSINYALAIVDKKKTDEVTDDDRTRFKDLLFDPKEKSGQIAFTTFHQNYAYEDFVEGIRPNVFGDQVGYEIRDGIFKNIAEVAIAEKEKNYVLIIDEIN
ncbi:MAG: hypothetical protein OXI60_09585 [Acidiferrobacterales bacterium]|nr:hypothetical protein [Acidiferrobacterales bacterium]